jgi:hypothetical protein
MSIGAIVNVKDGSSLDVRNRQDIFWMRGFAKMIKELDAENTEGDNGESFRGHLHSNVTTGLLEHLLDPPRLVC